MAVLTRVNGQQQAQLELAEIQAALSEEPATIGQLFTKGLLRVLILGVSLAVLQQVTGINVFLYYAPEILKTSPAQEWTSRCCRPWWSAR